MKVITICSGKGGVGKSFIASNLAYGLSKRNSSVLVWDADINFPNQHILFGVEPSIRAKDIYEHNFSINEALFNISPDLFLLADAPTPDKFKKVKPTMLHDVFYTLKNEHNFDYLIIDTPASNINLIIQSCSFADEVYAVINDEPTSLLDSYALIKILSQYFEIEKFKILVNNVIDSDDAMEFSEKLNLVLDKFLKRKLEIIGYVTYHRKVRESILEQNLFLKKQEKSDTSDKIMEIVDKIIMSEQQILSTN